MEGNSVMKKFYLLCTQASANAMDLSLDLDTIYITTEDNHPHHYYYGRQFKHLKSTGRFKELSKSKERTA